MTARQKIIMVICIFITSVICVLMVDYPSDIVTYDLNKIPEESEVFSAYVLANLEDNEGEVNKLFTSNEILDENNYINVYNLDKKEINSKFKEVFGKENKDIEDIDLENFSYTYFVKNIYFNYQFDTIDDGFGLNQNSEPGLLSILNIDYILDDNNYAFRLTSDDNTTLIYMKSDKIKDKSYIELYREYMKNHLEETSLYVFEDSVIFPKYEVNTNYYLKDKENYFYGANILIDGSGENYGNINTLEEDFKYDFRTESVLFIIKEDCVYPNIIKVFK